MPKKTVRDIPLPFGSDADRTDPDAASLVRFVYLGKFLLPAVIQGQADWGKAMLLAAGLVILLPVGRWLLEETLREVQRKHCPAARQIEITRWGLVVVFAMTAGWIMQVVDSVGPVELESLPAGVRPRFLLAAGLPLVLIWAAAIAVGWRWGERLRALEETADEAGQQLGGPGVCGLPLPGWGSTPLLTVAWFLSCGGLVGAHPVLPVRAKHKTKKTEGFLPSAFLMRFRRCPPGRPAPGG